MMWVYIKSAIVGLLLMSINHECVSVGKEEKYLPDTLSSLELRISLLQNSE